MEQSLDFNKIPPLSEGEIEEKAYKMADLWMVHHEKKIYGPYHVALLKQVAQKYSKELEPSSACNLERGRWLFFFDNTAFQFRNDQTFYKPYVVTNEELLIYANEKEHGPYTFPELVHHLKNKKFKYVDLFSINKGESWRKIYEIDGLDRRKEDDAQLKLPDIPKTSAYSEEQLKFIKKSSGHNVVLELKKITPSKGTQTTARPSTSRRTRSERPARSLNNKPSHSSKLPLFLLLLILLAASLWFLREPLKKMFSSQKDETSRLYNRKVSKFNLALKPQVKDMIRKRETPREKRNIPRKIIQKEFNMSNLEKPTDDLTEQYSDNNNPEGFVSPSEEQPFRDKKLNAKVEATTNTEEASDFSDEEVRESEELAATLANSDSTIEEPNPVQDFDFVATEPTEGFVPEEDYFGSQDSFETGSNDFFQEEPFAAKEENSYTENPFADDY